MMRGGIRKAKKKRQQAGTQPASGRVSHGESSAAALIGISARANMTRSFSNELLLESHLPNFQYESVTPAVLRPSALVRP
jgi:hypothetical protein